MALLSEDQRGARSKALSTPEIIASIIDAICDGPRWGYCQTLFACSLINSSWETEARRRLWEYCGFNDKVYRVPGLSHLLNIELSRRQDFAKHIRRIFITDFNENIMWSEWQGQYIPQLEDLAFPCLEEISLEGLTGYESYQKTSLKRLVGPRLKKASVSGNHTLPKNVISEEWIVNLTNQSRGLQDFSFSCDWQYKHYKHNVSPAALISFLESMHSLTSLQWDMAGSLSKVAFETIARMLSLKKLAIPKIRDGWVSNIGNFGPDNCFRSLEHLECEISAEAMAELLPLLPRLKQLHVESQNDTEQVVKSISDFTPENLEILKIKHGPLASIRATDILKTARTAPNLRCLEISPIRSDPVGTSNDVPDLLGLNDDLMDSLALFLSKIEEIQLMSIKTEISERSLIALGNHCPALTRCALTAKLNFKELLRLQNETSTSWPKLAQLFIFNHDRQNEGDESYTGKEISDFRDSWKGIMKAMTALQTVLFESLTIEYLIESILRNDESIRYTY